MTEIHTCKICLVKVQQLRKHLTMKHDTSLMEYLKKYKCGAEFTRIDDNLRLHRSKNSPWSINYYISRGQTLIEATESLKKIRERMLLAPS